MEQLTFAFASNNKKDLNSEHFGESEYYLIYSISKNESVFLKKIKNTSPEEKMHSDPKKAKGVANLLKPHKVQVLVNKAFGGNIIKMKQKFVCIVATQNSINENIENIKQNFDTIKKLWQQGEERDYIKL